MEAKVMEITLALLISLAGNFQSGLKLLDEKQYTEAEVQFTKVIEAEPNVTDFRELAYLYRAESYLGSKEKEKALADLTTLIKSTEDLTRRAQAIALFQDNGGDLQALLPKDGPKDVMDKVLAELQAGDEKAVKAHLSGGLLQLLNTVDQVFKQQAGGRSYLMQAGREFRNVNFESEAINETNQTARLSVNLSGSSLTFGMEQKRGAWVFSDLLAFMPEHRHHNHGMAVQGGSAVAQDTNKLRQLDSAMEQYMMASRKTPERLADVAEYLRDFAGTSVSAVDSKPFVFAIPKKGNKPWVFTSTATDGQRQGVINGTVQMMAEAEFKALAKSNGVRFEKEWKVVAITDEEEADIRGLIAKLGAKTSKERQAAADALLASGEKVGPFLEEATHSSDPEIALQAQSLLDAL